MEPTFVSVIALAPTRTPLRALRRTRTPFSVTTPVRRRPRCAVSDSGSSTSTDAAAPTSASSPSPPSIKAPAQVPFEIRGFSLANVFLLAGIAVTVVSFTSYFSSNGTASATSLGFVYGVPILLVGCALKYAELKPIPLRTDASARALRDSASTETLRKVISDVTRHRYGDEAHLSAALSALGLVVKGQPCPKLVGVAESKTEQGKYCLALDFVSNYVPYKAWEERIAKYESFFGPNISAETKKLDADKRLVQLRLTATE